MRKRTIHNLIFNIFFYSILLFPLIAFSLGISSGNVVSNIPNQNVSSTIDTNYLSFNDYMQGLGLDTLSDNIISSSIEDIFGANGVLPLFPQNSAFVSYLTYIVTIYLLRLALIPILFIPKLAIKFTDSFTRSDD